MAGYPQRTDLIQDPTYGNKAEQNRQAAAVRPQAQPGMGGGGGGGVVGSPAPPPQLDAPSARPGEPVTSGIDIGPGAGSEALGMDPSLLTAATIRQLYQRFPSETLMRVLADLEQR